VQPVFLSKYKVRVIDPDEAVSSSDYMLGVKLVRSADSHDFALFLKLGRFLSIGCCRLLQSAASGVVTEASRSGLFKWPRHRLIGCYRRSLNGIMLLSFQVIDQVRFIQCELIV
jgi:hypothetical protein